MLHLRSVLVLRPLFEGLGFILELTALLLGLVLVSDIEGLVFYFKTDQDPKCLNDYNKHHYCDWM